MTPRALLSFCIAKKNVLLAVAAVAVAVAAVASSVDERGAGAAMSANFKWLTVAAAVALLIRLVSHKDEEEQGTFSISGPQGPRELEVTGLTKGE